MTTKKRVLVTGASRGFGALTSAEFARRGYEVFAGMRDPSRAAALDDACAKAGVAVHRVQLDVTRGDSIARAMDMVERVDVLVNNAGIGQSGFFEEVTPEEFDAVIDTNFRGAVSMMRAVVTQMRRRGSGSIINVSSIYGFLGAPIVSAYAASKWALEGFTESLRGELAPFGVQVSLIEPGYFATDILGDPALATKKLYDPASPYHAAVVAVMDNYKKTIVPKAGDPMVVARLICDVAEKPRPALRHVVGGDGRLLRALRSLLPASAFERMLGGTVARALGPSAR